MKIFTMSFFFLISTAAIKAQWVQTIGPLKGSVSNLTVFNKKLFAATDSDGVFVSTNLGDSWIEDNNGLTNKKVSAFSVSDTNLFAATEDNGIYRIGKNETSWVQVGPGLIENTSLIAFIGTKLFACTHTTWNNSNYTLYISNNFGTTWDSILSVERSVGSICVKDSNIFALTGNGLYHSSNNGANWTMNTHLADESHLFTSNGNIFVADDYGVFCSNDDGYSWNEADKGLPLGQGLWSFVASGENIFTGTELGVYLSTNNGASWNKWNDGLQDTNPPFSGFEDFAFSSNYVFGTLSNSRTIIWRRPLSEAITDVKSDKNYIATRFSLQQNYPNPFNPSTSITYSIPQTQKVLIKVYDVLGKEIETLINEEKSPGNYEVTFNATNLPSGVYFYRLQAGSFVETKKMILLK